jgi:ABC-type branched-subunit amino acid transport system substrate-binding protein/tRNA A-37 threonylcarbamoyl transferase component Bud32
MAALDDRELRRWLSGDPVVFSSGALGTETTVGRAFLDYSIEEPIGQGGMGVVYAAQDERLKRKVALKLMAPELALDERFRERFTRESELAMSLEHPNVVPIHDAGESDGRLYLVMRRVEGTDLRALLSAEGALEPDRALAIVRQIAQALDAAHARGLVHRDVKPSNVLLDEREHVYLADFGLTRRQTDEPAQPGEGRSIGTPAYLAPEQIEGGPIDGQADVYSLGCLLYECLTGEPPFPGRSRLEVGWAHLEHEPPSTSGRNQALPAAIDAVIRRAMAKDPAERYATCSAMVQAAEAALGIGRSAVPRRRRRALEVATAALGALLLVAVGAAALQRRLGDDDDLRAAGALALDPESGEVVASVPLGTYPSAVAVGEGSVWIVDADDRTVSQIDSETRTAVRTFSTSSTPTDVAVGAGGVWIGNALSAGSFLPTSVTRLDPETGLVVATIELPPPPGGHVSAYAGFSRQHIAVSEDAVWVVNPDLSVSRIDPHSNRIVAAIDDVRAENIASGEGDVWITEGDGVTEIDPSLNAVARRVSIGEDTVLAGIAIGGGAVWVAAPGDGKLWRVDTGPSAARRAIALDTWVAGVSFGEGAVWATNEIADSVHRVDPRTASVRRLSGEMSARAVDAGDGAVWLTAAPPSRHAVLPAAVCGDVYYEREGSPDLLIVSSLPLQGDGRAVAQTMVEAVRHVLGQRGFEAGAFSVGYQSCGSSTAQAGAEDFSRCGFIAKAFARNLAVVGVFGSYTSFCSSLQIPIANQAQDGPLAMLSPSNTDDVLTEDRSLYPSGERSYFRLATPNRYQGAAQVELAKQLGHERLFLLTSSEEDYGAAYPAGVRRYARQAGVRIVGTAAFDPDAESFARLARRVASSRPESVAIVGVLTRGTGTLIRELRSTLGREVSLSAPDSFYLPEALRKLAGGAAEGMYVTNYGVPNDRLPPAGKRFLESFATERGGDPGPDFAASYGAQAAEILLGAIARSDGTRASVTEEVRQTQIRDGVLGDIAFDWKGDLVEGAITILRFVHGGFVVDRVVRVRPATLQ